MGLKVSGQEVVSVLFVTSQSAGTGCFSVSHWSEKHLNFLGVDTQDRETLLEHFGKHVK